MAVGGSAELWFWLRAAASGGNNSLAGLISDPIRFDKVEGNELWCSYAHLNEQTKSRKDKTSWPRSLFRLLGEPRQY